MINNEIKEAGPPGFDIETYPVKIFEVEISEPIRDLVLPDDPSAPPYKSGLVLARLHTYPLGLIDIDIQDLRVPSSDLSARIFSHLHSQINQHLRQDDLPRAGQNPVEDVLSSPRCLEEQREILKSPPLVSVVIATRDRVQSLADTLETLYAEEYPNFEIVLVDNAPRTEETHEFWSENRDRFVAKGIDLRYVREDVPGLAVAHNRGLEEIRGSIVAFTDDDVIVDRRWLLGLVDGFRAAEDVGCVTGLVIPYELLTPSQILFEQFGGFTKGFDQVVYDLEEDRPDNPLFPYCVGRLGTGANMAFRIQALEAIGGFDPALGIGTPTCGADDLDAFFQIIDKGYRLVYQPSALAYHRHRQTYESLRRQMRGYGMGLTAFLTKCLLENPLRIVDIAARLPAGLRYIFSSASEKNKHKFVNYPPELDRIERIGMLNGPLAYLRSVWQYRNQRKKVSFGKVDASPAIPLTGPKTPLGEKK